MPRPGGFREPTLRMLWSTIFVVDACLLGADLWWIALAIAAAGAAYTYLVTRPL